MTTQTPAPTRDRDELYYVLLDAERASTVEELRQAVAELINYMRNREAA